MLSSKINSETVRQDVNQMTELNKKALGGLLVFLVVMGALLFVPAWTVNYWQAWIFLAVFGGASLAITVYLMKRDPKLLQRRMKAGPGAEKQTRQKVIQSITSAGFIAILVVSALDHRFRWLPVTRFVSVAGEVLVGAGLLIIFLVYKENTFASATIEVVPEQKVISTGLYAMVRHPMYMGALLMFIGIPLSLGSGLGVMVLVLSMPALLWRLLDEEKFLAKNLPGYPDYQAKVRQRLLPFVW
jgi:protein-S-isoprenylcysteine O-methyltransferase Ste14